MKKTAQPPDAPPRDEITGVVLAGGRGQRMGGVDKGLVPLSGRPMIEHVLEKLRSQVGVIVINANRNRERYAVLGATVIPDFHEGYPGPLAGVASGLQAAATRYVVTVPCDSPFFGANLVARLYRALAREDADISVAHDGVRVQPLFLLLKRELLPDLLDYLAAGGRKAEDWIVRHRLAVADFSDQRTAFVNVNSPEERESVEKKLRGSKSP